MERRQHRMQLPALAAFFLYIILPPTLASQGPLFHYPKGMGPCSKAAYTAMCMTLFYKKYNRFILFGLFREGYKYCCKIHKVAAKFCRQIQQNKKTLPNEVKVESSQS